MYESRATGTTVQIEPTITLISDACTVDTVVASVLVVNVRRPHDKRASRGLAAGTLIDIVVLDGIGGLADSDPYRDTVACSARTCIFVSCFGGLFDGESGADPFISCCAGRPGNGE